MYKYIFLSTRTKGEVGKAFGKIKEIKIDQAIIESKRTKKIYENNNEIKIGGNQV